MADVIVTLTGNEAALYRSIQRIVDQQKKMETGFDGVKNKSKGASDATKTSMNEATVSATKLNSSIDTLRENFESGFSVDGIQSIATGLIGISTLAGTASAAIEQWQAAKAGSIESLQTVSEADRKILQVSKTPEDLEAMQKRADNAAKEYGVSRIEARTVLFQARSIGFEKDYEKLMAASSAISPSASAIAAGKVPKLFGGKIGPMESVSLIHKGAQASDTDFEKMATVLPSIAEGSSLAGASPEETVAVLSVLSARFKSADTAADRMKAFATAGAIDPNLAGQGIVHAFESIAAMSEDGRKEFLGKSQELNVAYGILQEELPTIKTRLAELQKERADYAAGGGALAETVRIGEANASVRANRKVNASEISKEVAQETRFARQAADVRALSNEISAQADIAGMGIESRWWVNKTKEHGAEITRAIMGKELDPESTTAAAEGYIAGFARSLPSLYAKDALMTGRLFPMGNAEVATVPEKANNLQKFGGWAEASARVSPKMQEAFKSGIGGEVGSSSTTSIAPMLESETAATKHYLPALEARATSIRAGGVTESEKDSYSQTMQAIESIKALMEEVKAARLADQAKLEQQNALLERIANNGSNARDELQAAVKSSNALATATRIGSL